MKNKLLKYKIENKLNSRDPLRRIDFISAVKKSVYRVIGGYNLNAIFDGQLWHYLFG